MKRREFIALLGGAVALAPFDAASQPGLPVIGYLSNRSAEAETPLRTAFLDGLEQQGFAVGRKVAIEYRFAEGNNACLPSLAVELIGLPAAVLVAYGLPAALPAGKATATIPIVFILGFDPVQLGLVASYNQPAGNATGVHMFEAEVISKRLELPREVLPQPGLIAYLHPGWRTPAAPVELREVEAAAQAVGQPILVLQGGDEDEIDKAFATMAEREVRGLLFGPTTYFPGDRRQAHRTRRALPHPRHLRMAPIRRCGRLDELQRETRRTQSARRRLRRTHPEGRRPRRSAGHPINALRAGHQPGDRQGSQPDDPAHGAAARRRGHRVRLLTSFIRAGHAGPPSDQRDRCDVTARRA